jgi:reactive intermediate/imine deaminase
MKLMSLLMISFSFCAFVAFTGETQQANQQPSSSEKAAQSQPKESSSPPLVEYLSGDRQQPRPYSDAVRVGNLLYLSGQVGAGDQSGLVPGGIKAETKQVMERIGRLLERNGSSLSQVVKCTCFLADISEWAAMSEVYASYFPKDRLPARSAIAVGGLPLGARVEIECIAAVK